MAGSDYRLIGLDSVAFSFHNLTTAGFPTAANFTTITAIVPDSAVMAIETPGKTELMVEDSEYADIVINSPAAKYIEFATRDMTPENFRIAFGGTTASTYWKAPNANVVVTEGTVKALSKTYGGKYFEVQVKRAAIRGGANLRFSKTESGAISYTCDVLRPIHTSTDVPIKVMPK